MYQNYIFDLYGTLVDIHTNEHTGYFWKKCAALLTEFGYPYESAALKKRYGELIELEKRKLEGRYAYPEIDLVNVFEALCLERGPAPSQEFLSFYASAFRVISRKYLCLYPEIPAILDLLKRHDKKIYLLSNAQTLFTISEMKQLGIYHYFDDIMISSDCHCKKPDSAFMQMLIDKHHLNISESLMIGNEYASDIAVAKSVGMDNYYIKSNLTFESPSVIDATYSDLTGRSLKLTEFKKLL